MPMAIRFHARRVGNIFMRSTLLSVLALSLAWPTGGRIDGRFLVAPDGPAGESGQLPGDLAASLRVGCLGHGVGHLRQRLARRLCR
jgi:hypothetical protein